VDTNEPEQEDTADFEVGAEYEVTARSLLLFELCRGEDAAEPPPPG
jgi:hypothetical protein